MKPRKEEKQRQRAAAVRTEQRKPKLRIVKLEERITPRLSANHNETLVRYPAKDKRKTADVHGDEQKPKFQIVKLEERIAPKLSANHNETLVSDGPAIAR
jgi:hypothetical protein